MGTFYVTYEVIIAMSPENNKNKSKKSRSVVDINIHKYNFAEIKKEQLPYTLICNRVIQECRNPMAGFIWIYLQSKPENWIPCRWEIMQRFSISEPTFKRHMQYLKAAGLIELHQSRKEDGTLGDIRMHVLNGTKFNPDGDSYRGIIFDATNDSNVPVDNFSCDDQSKNDPPAEPALNLASDRGIKNDPPAFNRWIKKPVTGEMNPHTKERSLYKKKKNKTPISPTGKRSSFSLSEMLKDNPFDIPETVLVDWIAVRNGKRAKITATAWAQALNNLQKLKEAGLVPLDCFLKAVASGWSGVEFRYFERDIEALNGKKDTSPGYTSPGYTSPGQSKYTSPGERAIAEQKIREREFKAQEEKRKEIEQSKNFKEMLNQTQNTKGYADARKKSEEEIKRLGIPAAEYYSRLLKNAKETERNDKII